MNTVEPSAGPEVIVVSRRFEVSDDCERPFGGSGVDVFEFVYGAHFKCMFAGLQMLGDVG